MGLFKKNQVKKDHESVNWYEDKYQSMVVWRNWLFVLTFIALAGVLAMTFAMYYFVPLKTVKPFVIQIDERTGEAKVILTESEKEISKHEATVKYFMRSYVEARETYDYDGGYSRQQKVVQSMSDKSIYEKYKNFINPNSNPSAPINVYGRDVKRAIRITEIKRLNKDELKGTQVWEAVFIVTLSRNNQRPRTYKASAVMKLGFVEGQVAQENLKYNPLGIAVISYRLEDDAF